MTDLHDTPVQPAAASAVQAGERDPLHDLYRMSRTAGLGSGDYVAINNTAVLAFLLGLAGVLALLSPMLAVLPLAAVVCGALALVQIRSSNGTQTGRAFAALGILLGLGFGGVTAVNMLRGNVERRADAQEIAKAIKSLGDLLVREQYGGAYQSLFSEQFKDDFREDVFTTRWENIKRTTGTVESVTWGGRAEFERVRATNTRRGFALARFKFANVAEESPLTVSLVKQDGEWMIDKIGDIFDPVQERAGSQDPSRTGPALPTSPLPGGQP